MSGFVLIEVGNSTAPCSGLRLDCSHKSRLKHVLFVSQNIHTDGSLVP